MSLRTKYWLVSTLLFTVLSLILGGHGVSAQASVEVWFDPQDSQVGIGATTAVQLMVNAPVAVGGFDLTLDYDPDLLHLDAWKYGDFLSKLYIVKKEDTPGHLRLVSVQLAVPPVAGEGKLLEFTFRGLAIGSSPLTLSNVTLANATGNQYAAGVTNASINVITANTRTPTPSTPYPLPATATRTSVPIATATGTPPTPYPFSATSTRTPMPTQTGVTARTATFTRTAQSGLIVTPALQTTAGNDSTDMQDPASAFPTDGIISGSLLPTTPTSGMTTDPTVLPIRPDNPSDALPEEENTASKSSLIIGILVFDSAALVFVIFLVWKRRRKNKERQE